MEMAVTTLARGNVRLVICLHTSQDPPPTEWEHMLQDLSAHLSSSPAAWQVRMLVVTGGGGPDAKQRAQLREVWQERDIKVAVLIPGRANPLKRGLMTALGWLNPGIAFFTPEELRRALAHLEQDDALDVVWKELGALQQRLQKVPTLQRIALANALPELPEL